MPIARSTPSLSRETGVGSLRRAFGLPDSSSPRPWLRVVLQDGDISQPGATQDRIVDDALDIWFHNVDAVEVEQRNERRFLVEERLGLFVLGNARLLIAHYGRIPDQIVELIVLPVGMVEVGFRVE